MAKRTSAQNRQIWGLVGQLARLTGLDGEDAEELMRQEVEALSGQRSTAQLTESQASKLIKRLKYLVWQAGGGREKQKRPKSPLEPITKAMQQVIQHLWEDAGIYQPQSRQSFTKRICGGKPWPQTLDDGSKLIEALKSVVERRASLADLFCRCTRLLTQRGRQLTEWEREFLVKIRAELKEGRMIKSGAIGKLKEIEGKHRTQGVGDGEAAGKKAMSRMRQDI
jgi:hypothetical protein